MERPTPACPYPPACPQFGEDNVDEPARPAAEGAEEGGQEATGGEGREGGDE